jgi:hypothetical protein
MGAEQTRAEGTSGPIPRQAAMDAMNEIKAKADELAEVVNSHVSDSRRKSIFFTHLETGLLYAMEELRHMSEDKDDG